MGNNSLVLYKDRLPEPLEETFMIAGFKQWANAGNVSSGIPEHLIQKLQPTKIGHIENDEFYIYQLSGRHYEFRPPVKYKEGYEKAYQEAPRNDFYYSEIDGKGLVIFLGTEPNMKADAYANALLDGAKELGVKRIVASAGVGAEVPFEKERSVSVAYSLAHMKEDLERYAVRFSNYRMTATIGMTINHHAKNREMEFVRMSALTPAYSIVVNDQPLTMKDDTTAFLGILRRVRYMFGINLDLSDLEKESDKLISDWDSQFRNLTLENSDMSKYVEAIRDNFEEIIFQEPVQVDARLVKQVEDLLENIEGQDQP